MSSNRKLTKDQWSELVEYAHNVLQENPKCSNIMRWTRDHNHQLENFMIAYTLVKYGKVDEKSFQDVISAFNEKHKIEMEEIYNQGSYGCRLWSHKDSPLYQAILHKFEQHNIAENEIKVDFKI